MLLSSFIALVALQIAAAAPQAVPAGPADLSSPTYHLSPSPTARSLRQRGFATRVEVVTVTQVHFVKRQEADNGDADADCTDDEPTTTTTTKQRFKTKFRTVTQTSTVQASALATDPGQAAASAGAPVLAGAGQGGDSGGVFISSNLSPAATATSFGAGSDLGLEPIATGSVDAAAATSTTALPAATGAGIGANFVTSSVPESAATSAPAVGYGYGRRV